MIGLLVWLYLGARVVVYSAEINTVLTRDLWPRSILDPPTPADRRVRAALAKVEERDDKQTVDVTFHPDLKEPVDPANPAYAVAPEPAPGERRESAPLPDGIESPAGEPGRAADRPGAGQHVRSVRAQPRIRTAGRARRGGSSPAARSRARPRPDIRRRPLDGEDR